MSQIYRKIKLNKVRESLLSFIYNRQTALYFLLDELVRGGAMVPPILKKERGFAYYKYLELAQAREITDSLEMFIAEAILETAEKSRRRLEGTGKTATRRTRSAR